MEDSNTEIVDEEMNVDAIPSMNIAVGNKREEEIISDQRLLTIYDNILQDIKDDRLEVDQILSQFVDRVLGEGSDASTSSKEALVNLLKIKNDSADKMTKVADLMTRLKLKEKDTFPRYLAAQQNNKITIETNKRGFLKEIQKQLRTEKSNEGK